MKEFGDYEGAVIMRGGKYFLDMPTVLKIQLENAGIKKENIGVSGECTYCLENKYFSFRRDKEMPLKAMIAYIGIK